MFKVIVGMEHSGKSMGFTARIEGCPYCGIEAIDFRRNHGLPEAPNNKVDLPGFVFVDEEFVRWVKNNPLAQYKNRVNANADIDCKYDGGRQQNYHLTILNKIECGSVNKVCADSYSGNHVYIEPEVIRDYLASQDNLSGATRDLRWMLIDAAKRLLLSLWTYPDRKQIALENELKQRQNEEAQLKERENAARQLLKSELDSLKDQAERFYKQAEEWKKRARDMERLAREKDALAPHQARRHDDSD